MIRSGYHDLWDAQVRTIPARARIVAIGEALAPLAEVGRRFGIAATAAAAALGKMGLAYERAGELAELGARARLCGVDVEAVLEANRAHPTRTPAEALELAIRGQVLS